MSRIGNKQINLPAGVSLEVTEGNLATVKGPKGELSLQVNPNIEIKVEGNLVTLARPNDTFKAIHGTSRALLANMVKGVSEGFSKKLVIVGVGYRAALEGNTLVVNAGYSHQVRLDVPQGLKVELPKNTEVIISGADKQVVGQFAAVVRQIRKPEPYKGKGIAYEGEKIRRKEGKTAKK
jgi:large subunit ribosomal protein L6